MSEVPPRSSQLLEENYPPSEVRVGFLIFPLIF